VANLTKNVSFVRARAHILFGVAERGATMSWSDAPNPNQMALVTWTQSLDHKLFPSCCAVLQREIRERGKRICRGGEIREREGNGFVGVTHL
jgi:hypothetical protein